MSEWSNKALVQSRLRSPTFQVDVKAYLKEQFMNSSGQNSNGVETQSDLNFSPEQESSEFSGIKNNVDAGREIENSDCSTTSSHHQLHGGLKRLRSSSQGSEHLPTLPGHMGIRPHRCLSSISKAFFQKIALSGNMRSQAQNICNLVALLILQKNHSSKKNAHKVYLKQRNYQKSRFALERKKTEDESSSECVDASSFSSQEDEEDSSTNFKHVQRDSASPVRASQSPNKNQRNRIYSEEEILNKGLADRINKRALSPKKPNTGFEISRALSPSKSQKKTLPLRPESPTKKPFSSLRESFTKTFYVSKDKSLKEELEGTRPDTPFDLDYNIYCQNQKNASKSVCSESLSRKTNNSSPQKKSLTSNSRQSTKKNDSQYSKNQPRKTMESLFREKAKTTEIPISSEKSESDEFKEDNHLMDNRLDALQSPSPTYPKSIPSYLKSSPPKLKKKSPNSNKRRKNKKEVLAEPPSPGTCIPIQASALDTSFELMIMTGQDDQKNKMSPGEPKPSRNSNNDSPTLLSALNPQPQPQTTQNRSERPSFSSAFGLNSTNKSSNESIRVKSGLKEQGKNQQSISSFATDRNSPNEQQKSSVKRKGSDFSLIPRAESPSRAHYLLDKKSKVSAANKSVNNSEMRSLNASRNKTNKSQVSPSIYETQNSGPKKESSGPSQTSIDQPSLDLYAPKPQKKSSVKMVGLTISTGSLDEPRVSTSQSTKRLKKVTSPAAVVASSIGAIFKN